LLTQEGGIDQILNPNGHPIGRAGSGPSIRIVEGGQPEAEKLFTELK
jgi:hypothetical protein